MLKLTYDGSFPGLLTAIFESYYSKLKPQGIVNQNNDLQLNIMDEYLPVYTDNEKARRVLDSIISKISRYALEMVYYSYLSELDGIETDILGYLKFGFKTGRDVDRYLTDERVMKIHNAHRKVSKESHLLLGLLRFKEMVGDIYYASLAPDHNVLPLMADHFSKRMADQNFIIHDVKRNIAVIYDKSSWRFASAATDIIPKYTENELTYQNLWKEFFNTICIKDRLNPKCQKRLMPKRYWKYLVEKEN